MRIALLSLVVLASACSTVNAVHSSESFEESASVADEASPHYWVIREVNIPVQGTMAYGLFACAKVPTPNQSPCRLAKQSGLLADVATPGAVMMRDDGTFHQF